MITVSGSPFDISALAGAYEDGGVQTQLLSTMSESGGSYQYSDLDQLKFELELRNEIVNAAYALHNSRLNFAVFHDTRCNSDYWDRTSNGGFSLKSGAEPSAAINDIFDNGGQYATECATAIMIVYYKALLEVFGDESFNKTFTRIYLMNWDIREPLLKEAGAPKKVDDMLLGDRGYFMNPDVDPQTPQWQGENVIVLPGSLYYGHGIGLTTADGIIKALNFNRKKGSTTSAYFMDDAGRPDFKTLAKKYYSPAGESVLASAAGTLVWKPFPAPIHR